MNIDEAESKKTLRNPKIKSISSDYQHVVKSIPTTRAESQNIILPPSKEYNLKDVPINELLKLAIRESSNPNNQPETRLKHQLCLFINQLRKQRMTNSGYIQWQSATESESCDERSSNEFFNVSKKHYSSPHRMQFSRDVSKLPKRYSDGSSRYDERVCLDWKDTLVEESGEEMDLKDMELSETDMDIVEIYDNNVDKNNVECILLDDLDTDYTFSYSNTRTMGPGPVEMLMTHSLMLGRKEGDYL